jgi:CheY-like chemotaxis protein
MPDMDGFELARRIHEMPALRGTTVMMLSSAGHLSDTKRCQDLGIQTYLVKPIFQKDLLRAIATAVTGQAAPCASIPLRPAERDQTDLYLRILLAEDNPINQRFAVHALKNHGHAVTVAADGREAVALFERESFDLILMDIQMPGMDGYEATHAIREAEWKTGGAHIPIVAMTAHALKSDEERCLAAGMDGFIAKPIHVKDLIRKVVEFAPKTVPVLG